MRLVDSCITQLKALGILRTCNESTERRGNFRPAVLRSRRDTNVHYMKRQYIYTYSPFPVSNRGGGRIIDIGTGRPALGGNGRDRYVHKI